MKTLNLLLLGTVLAGSLAVTAPASAQSITGVMNIGGTNYFDPANGYVPAGFGNTAGTTVAIGPGVEFGFFDGANTDTADFTTTSLLLNDLSVNGSIAVQYRFTASVNGFFNNLTLVSNTLGGTYSVAGNTLTYNAPNLSAGGTYSALFTFAGAAGAVPEPASWAMMILGMGAVGYAMRRRVRASEVKFDAKIKRMSAGAAA